MTVTDPLAKHDATRLLDAATGGRLGRLLRQIRVADRAKARQLVKQFVAKEPAAARFLAGYRSATGD